MGQRIKLIFAYLFFTLATSILVIGQDFETLETVVRTNTWVSERALSQLTINAVRENTLKPDTLFLNLSGAKYNQTRLDTIQVSFSGYMTNSQFILHGPYEETIFYTRTKEQLTSYASFDQNKLEGFLISVEPSTNEVRSIQFFIENINRFSVHIRNGYPSNVWSSLPDSYQLDSYFQEGMLERIDIYQEVDQIDSSLKLKNTKLESAGSYSQDFVHFRDIDDHIYFEYLDSLYRNPIEFTDEKETLYIQDAFFQDHTFKVPLKARVWFYGDEDGKIVTETHHRKK